MIRAQRFKTINLLSSYNNIIKDEYGINLIDKEDQKKQFHLLLIFIKYIKVKYYGLSNKSIAEFLDVERKNILLYLRQHDELFVIDSKFRNLSNYLRDRFRGIDSENMPVVYKEKLYELIEISPENVRKEFYELILNHHDILKHNLDNVK